MRNVWVRYAEVYAETLLDDIFDSGKYLEKKWSCCLRDWQYFSDLGLSNLFRKQTHWLASSVEVLIEMMAPDQMLGFVSFIFHKAFYPDKPSQRKALILGQS